jgi:hypothetical protein
MHIETTLGLVTGLTDSAEAVSGNWESWRDQLDVVKVIDPHPSSWPALRRAGFSVHPAWITWLAQVGASEDAFLTGLSRKERTTIRAAQRRAAERGIEFTVTSPVTAASFDAFLTLYEDQIRTMEHGIPFARLERSEILARASDYFSVEACAGDKPVGCCVCRIDRDISTVVIRFAASAPDARQQNIVRPMYMKVFDTVRRLGYRTVSLGSDPALYGHIAQAGLFTFKSGLRFTPVPARQLGYIDDPDEATMVLRLDALADPSLLVSYVLEPSPPLSENLTIADLPLQLDVFTISAPDLGPYHAPFLAALNICRLERITALAAVS